MKNILLKCSFVILLLTTCIYSQEKPEARLIDEFGKICSEDLMARYDGFMSAIQNSPDSKGYIVFNGGETQEGNNILYARYVSKIYPTFRGFDLNRIVFLKSKNLINAKTSFWLVPNGASPPEIKDFIKPKKVNSTTQFQRTFAEIFKYPNSDEQFVNGFYDLGCDFAPNFKDFAEVLKSDENLTGYLIIYGSKTQSKKKIKKFALRELVKTYKISKKRLKTVYGKKQEESEIELWFVPKGSNPPTPNK